MGIDVVFKDNTAAAIKRIASEAMGLMHESVNVVRNTTVETLSGNRSGRQYKVPGTNKMYTASAPGEPPAVQLGELRQSIATEVTKEGIEPVGTVGTTLPKGPRLEFGTSNMAARPWLRPSFEKCVDKVRSIFMRVWF